MEGCNDALSAAGIKSMLQRNARNRVAKEVSDRKRSVLYLICAFLREHNLHSSADYVRAEAQLSNDYEVCENIDLDTVLQEYQSYYFTKFSKHPKILRLTNKHMIPVPQIPRESHKRIIIPPVPKPQVQVPLLDNFQVDVRPLLTTSGDNSNTAIIPNPSSPKPVLWDFEGYSTEWREIAEIIEKEVVPKSLGVKWDDCVGLEKITEILKEAVTYPILYPDLFSGLTAPWKGVLLYGPPGTGKTLLSKAVACETDSKLFNVTSSCFVNKWRGESEKMVKVLFDLARLYAPSTIFIDEVDALACCQGDFQHDASRRFKSELLIQLDGILSEGSNVFVLATTNRPWDLDPAILRRFEKRVLVGAPCEESRIKIYKYYWWLAKNTFSENDFKEMGRASQNFSGSDIKHVCRETSMKKVREVFRQHKSNETLKLANPTMTDVMETISGIKPVTNTQLQQRYLKWMEEFGCN